MNVLLLSSGGGGGNILRSLKALFRQDLVVTQKADPRYAERLRRAIVTRFLDTNEFSLADVPKDERLLIGANTTRRLGARHDPDLAREALEESRADVESVIARYSVIILIGTGGKGTGAGTMFALAEMARQHRKLVIPVFVRPSFERHEVDKRRYDHALRVVEQFDAAKIRLIEILNDRGYSERAPQPESMVWERMNRPIARGLRALLYVLWDLSQVDPSDLSSLFGGDGRLRIGYSEVDPPQGHEPADAQIDEAVQNCWENRYYAFREPVGTSLVCIQGEWSNVVDSKIKGRLAALALGDNTDNPYNPLYARALHVPRPWGVTALFAEYTGVHAPLDIDWTLDRRTGQIPGAVLQAPEETAVVAPVNGNAAPVQVDEPPVAEPGRVEFTDPAPASPSFASFREFALALNRANPAAIALASNGAECELPIDGSEIRRLLGTLWFRSLFARLSQRWRDRILEALLNEGAMPDHALKRGRQIVHLSELTHDQMKEIVTSTILPDAVRTDVQLLVAVGTLWGSDVLRRFEFAPVAAQETSALGLLLQPFRRA